MNICSDISLMTQRHLLVHTIQVRLILLSNVLVNRENVFPLLERLKERNGPDKELCPFQLIAMCYTHGMIKSIPYGRWS